jgi:regulator of nucleoside diphosphate kinase
MRPAAIQITSLDAQRLRALLDNLDQERTTHPREAARLRRELERASIVSARQADAGLVTMNSRVVVRDLDRDREMTFTLAYPDDADTGDRMSVLAPIGTAVLGYHEGSVIEWEVPAGPRRLRIEKVLYQPETAGDLSR